MSNDIVLRLPRRDVGRLLVGVRDRRKKFERGMRKFANNFDPELGSNIKEGYAAFADLEAKLEEALR